MVEPNLKVSNPYAKTNISTQGLTGTEITNFNHFSEPVPLVYVKVVDATTNKPLPAANISFRDVHNFQYFGQGQTNQDGVFRVGLFRNGTVNNLFNMDRQCRKSY